MVATGEGGRTVGTGIHITAGVMGTIPIPRIRTQSYPVYDYSNAYAENDRQQAAIDRLEAEVDRLREEREAREARSSNAAQTSKSAVPPTELVFRDKHTEEVQNYAIVGQTFWILNAEKARKFPIAQLDIPATQKANEDRGVDFQLPE